MLGVTSSVPVMMVLPPPLSVIPLLPGMTTALVHVHVPRGTMMLSPLFAELTALWTLL